MKSALFLLVSLAAFANEQPVTLRQAVDMALQQNADITLARLNEQYASLGIRVSQDPFHPKVFVGSDLAVTVEGDVTGVLSLLVFKQ